LILLVYAKINHLFSKEIMMQIVLGIHNILRWMILLAAAYTLFRMIRGLTTKPAWTEADGKAGLVFSILVDSQMLLGLILYFVLSPLVKTFFANIGEAMQNSALRYWGIEHVGLMLAAVIFVHLGSAVGKKEITDQEKFKRGTIFFALVVVSLLAGIPWFRPLLPTF
jgi:hypothetical protein